MYVTTCARYFVSRRTGPEKINLKFDLPRARSFYGGDELLPTLRDTKHERVSNPGF